MPSTSFFTADQADEYLGGTGWFPAIEGRRKWRAEFLAEFLGAALTLPSLVAEVTPLVLFWNGHLPVWQMSSMMFGAWALVWWLTWIFTVPLWKRVRSSVGRFRRNMPDF
jgi:hypothetical protein